MDENEKMITELRQALRAEQEKITKLERRITTLEMQQGNNQGARFSVYDEQFKELREAIDLLKLQVKNLASGCP